MTGETAALVAYAELARLQARHTDHHIGQEVTQQGSSAERIRYVAYAAVPGARPHTVITDDLDELRAALESGTG